MGTHFETYQKINEGFGEIIKCSLNGDNEQKHADISNFYEDYNNWISVIGTENEEVIYKEAISEYSTMLLFLCMGLYKNAYMSLRGYFELTMFGVLISKSDYDFRLWKNELKDVHWSEITDKEQGLFSEIFISTYNKLLLENRMVMREEAKSLYRRCSEYIHTGYYVAVADFEVRFDQESYDRVCSDVAAINRIITYMFCVRYKDNLAKGDNKSLVEESILEQLRDIKEIHQLID